MLPFRAEGFFVSIPMAPYRVSHFHVSLRIICGPYVVETELEENSSHCAACDEVCRGREEATFSIPWHHTDVVCHVILATWRTTALIATTIDTMITTITSRAAIMEPENRAASTNPTTADPHQHRCQCGFEPPKPTRRRREDFVRV